MSTIYVSPTGSGQATGSSPSNALPVSSLDQAIQMAGPGGTVILLADQGVYNISDSINISHGGTDGAPVTVMGADSAGNPMDITIHGTRMDNYVEGGEPGNQVFKLLDGANNIKFVGMDFVDVGMGFCLGGNLRNVTIQNMEADNVRYFIGNYASGTATDASVNGLTIKDVEVHGFSKSVILLKYDTHNVTIDNVYGDSEYQDGDHFAMGVLLDDSVHDVVISNSTMKNTIGSESTGEYWNGDGFTTEENVYNVRFENCVSSGHADGGFDLKSDNTVLVNCIAEDNKRNFRLWGQAELDNCQGIDPHLRGGTGSQSQIWVGSGANVVVKGGYFADSGSDTQVVHSDGGKVTFDHTNFWYGSAADFSQGTGISGVDGTLVHLLVSRTLWSTDGEKYMPAGGSTPPPSGGSTPPPPPPGDPVFVPANKTLNGTKGNDTLPVTSSDHWTVNANGGNDKITTLGGNDIINAAGGNDIINTGAGNDYIHGGSGADNITGGTGADVFAYKALFDSNSRNGLDVVTDFEAGVDKLDLSALDANSTLKGNNAFTYLGEGAFSGHAGELRVDHSDPAKTVVYVDVNGDRVADLQINLVGNIQLQASDFIL